MICNVFKQRRRIDGQIVEAPNYTERLRMPWETSVSTVSLNTPDKRIALHKLLQLADEREKERNGILAPKPVREAAERPLLDLLSEYLQDVESRGRAVTTVKKYRKILRKLFARCRWLKLQDVTTRSFCQWRNQCGLTGKTTNDLLACATTFFDWLEGQRMLSENPPEIRQTHRHTRPSSIPASTQPGRNPKLALRCAASPGHRLLGGDLHRS